MNIEISPIGMNGYVIIVDLFFVFLLLFKVLGKCYKGFGLAFGGLTENPASTSKNGIIKIQKFLLVCPPADANLVLCVRFIFIAFFPIKTLSCQQLFHF